MIQTAITYHIALVDRLIDIAQDLIVLDIENVGYSRSAMRYIEGITVIDIHHPESFDEVDYLILPGDVLNEDSDIDPAILFGDCTEDDAISTFRAILDRHDALLTRDPREANDA